MKRLLNVDERWLAGWRNCPPQGNLGRGVDEVVEGGEGELQYFLLFQTFRGVVIEAREEHPVNGAGGSTLRRWREGGWWTLVGPVWNWCQYRQQVPHRQS